jgi:hypothetical protein
MVLNTRVKPALSRKQVGVTPVSNTGIKLHTGDPHQFNTSINPTKIHKREKPNKIMKCYYLIPPTALKKEL